MKSSNGPCPHWSVQHAMSRKATPTAPFKTSGGRLRCALSFLLFFFCSRELVCDGTKHVASATLSSSGHHAVVSRKGKKGRCPCVVCVYDRRPSFAHFKSDASSILTAWRVRPFLRVCSIISKHFELKLLL